MLKINFCDCNDAYILVRGDIITKAHNNPVGFKSCAPFTKCITKIDGSTIDNAEDLYLVMLIYNLLEYSSDLNVLFQAYNLIIKKITRSEILVILFIIIVQIILTQEVAYGLNLQMTLF